MDEDPKTEEAQGEAENVPDKSSEITAGTATAISLAVLLFVAVAVYFGIAQTVAGLFAVVGIPVVLLWFVWNLFLRRLWRIRRIRGVQERRELLEAARRGRNDDETQ